MSHVQNVSQLMGGNSSNPNSTINNPTCCHTRAHFVDVGKAYNIFSHIFTPEILMLGEDMNGYNKYKAHI